MSETFESPYKMSISLNVLDHLGLKICSNTLAVVAEVIANAWDANATDRFNRHGHPCRAGHGQRIHRQTQGSAVCAQLVSCYTE